MPLSHYLACCEVASCSAIWKQWAFFCLGEGWCSREKATHCRIETNTSYPPMLMILTSQKTAGDLKVITPAAEPSNLRGVFVLRPSWNVSSLNSKPGFWTLSRRRLRRLNAGIAGLAFGFGGRMKFLIASWNVLGLESSWCLILSISTLSAEWVPSKPRLCRRLSFF